MLQTISRQQRREMIALAREMLGHPCDPKVEYDEDEGYFYIAECVGGPDDEGYWYRTVDVYPTEERGVYRVVTVSGGKDCDGITSRTQAFLCHPRKKAKRIYLSRKYTSGKPSRPSGKFESKRWVARAEGPARHYDQYAQAAGY